MFKMDAQEKIKPIFQSLPHCRIAKINGHLLQSQPPGVFKHTPPAIEKARGLQTGSQNRGFKWQDFGTSDGIVHNFYNNKYFNISDIRTDPKKS